MIAYYYSPSERWSTARRYLIITVQHRQMCVLFLPSHSLSLTVSSSSGVLCCLHLLVYSNRLVDLIIIHYHWVESIAPCICLWNIRCIDGIVFYYFRTNSIWISIHFSCATVALLVISCPSGTLMCENYCKWYVRRPMSIFNEQSDKVMANKQVLKREVDK